MLIRFGCCNAHRSENQMEAPSISLCGVVHKTLRQLQLIWPTS